MKIPKIKTEWASARFQGETRRVICVRGQNGTECMRFDDVSNLKRAISGREISARKWIAAVPDDCCIFKSLQLPAKDIAEAAEMLEFEVPSLVPLPPEELIYGCTLLFQDENMLTILVCMIRRNILKQQLEPYKAVGITPNKVIFDSLAMQCWFKSVKTESSESRVDILGNGESFYLINTKKGNFQNADEIKMAEKGIREDLVSVVKEAVSQKSVTGSDNSVVDILIAGLEESSWKSQDSLQKKLNSPAVKEISFLDLPEAKSYEGNVLNSGGTGAVTESVIALGLIESLRDGGLEYLNLLPREDLHKAQSRRRFINYFTAGILAVLLLLLVWLSLSGMNWRLQKRGELVVSRIAPIEDVAGGVESKRELVEAVHQQLFNRGQLTKVFLELYKFSPEGVAISRLKVISDVEGLKIEINGQAETLSKALEYSNAMKAATILDGLRIINAQQIPRPGGSVVEFQAECLFLEG